MVSDFHWMQLGACYEFGVLPGDEKFVPEKHDYWFDAYEQDDDVARNVDAMCLTCPAIAYCYDYGIDNKEYGVWGGVYLENGRVSEPKNRHKTEETWEQVKTLHKKL